MQGEEQVKIVTATLEEISHLYNLQEDWSDGTQNDSKAYMAADPNGQFLLKQNQKIIGLFSCFRYSNFYGYIGKFFVLPQLRSKGYGKLLLMKGLKYLQGCTIQADHVFQANTLQFIKFKLYSKLISFQIKGLKSEGKQWQNIKKIDQSNFDKLVEYDSTIFPIQRKLFLKEFLFQPESIAILYEEQGQIKGYGFMRKGRFGKRLGPLFAQSQQVVGQLLQFLRNQLGEEQQMQAVSVMKCNQKAMNLFGAVSFKHQQWGSRSYRGQINQQKLNKMYTTTGWQFG